ncbi:MAG: hypothetical protein IPM48_08155 [Saprospiraceae bacterium]|nr:hypothetical protein [Saprospiraceae bacterium]
MKYNKFLFVILIAISWSCTKSNDAASNSDYLIFGHYFGFCGGEKCIEIFKLTDTSLYEDSNDLYPNSDGFYPGNYFKLTREKFEQVKDLADKFPDTLLQIKDRMIGTPDAGDWGGFYVERKNANERSFWLLDKHKANVPISLHEFMDLMDEKIQLLQ